MEQTTPAQAAPDGTRPAPLPPAAVTAILERITDAFYALDANWRFTYVNSQGERMLGRAKGTLAGTVVWTEFPEAVGSTFWHEYHRAVREQEPVSFTEYYPPLAAWFEVNAYPGPDGLSVYFRDVTRQRAVQEELAQSRTRLVFALEAGQMGSWEWDIAADRVIWSPQQERLYGLEPGTFGGTVAEYRARIHPGDADSTWQASADALADGARDHHVRHRILRADGEVRWLESHGRFVLDASGKPLRLVGVSSDVTDRVRFEHQRERQDQMLGTVDVGLWYCDLPFDVLVWDAKTKDHFWLPPDAHVTIGLFYDRIHSEDRERTRAAIERSISERVPYDIEYRTVAPPGHVAAGAERWVRAIGYTAYDRAGQPLRFDGVTVDVTASKRTAERLAWSEQRYDYAARAASNAIWDWDLVSNHADWTSGITTVFGHALANVGTTGEWWYEHLHPEDRDRVVSGIHAVIDGADGGHSWQDEYRFRRSDGSWALVRDRGYVARDAAGRALRMVGAMEDVTRQRESELRLRQLSEAIPVQVWTARADGMLEYVSARVADYFGETIAGLLGEGWVRFVHPDDVARVAGRWAESLATGAPYETEFRLRRHDGAWRWHLTRALPVRDAEGRPVAWYGSNTDIDDRKAAERARDAALADAERARSDAEEAQRRAEHANRGKSDFLAAMSHDLRTPLNAIGGYTSLLSEGIYGPVTERQVEAMVRVQRAQQHLLALINDVLNFARIEAGKLQMQLTPLDLPMLLEEVRTLIEPQVLGKGLAFTQEEVPPVRVLADQERVVQVLLNLLGNAVKFTDAGSVAVSARAADGTVAISVRDTGRGIAPEKLASIFDPFVQLDRAAADRREGVGLGLAISRELARAMGGDVTVTSVPGAGSTFTLVLPRANAGS